jgi:Zn-dependent protease
VPDVINQQVIIERLLLLILLWISLGVHEWAHAWAAWKLGDDTAAMLGRLTLNPLAHLDPIGTVLLPLLGIPFGWAKPVPVQPTRFRRAISMRKGMMIVALAGPLANFVQVVFGTALLIVLIRMYHASLLSFSDATWEKITHLFVTYIAMNISLAIFNFIPVPPLDGSHVVDALLPYSLRPAWTKFCNQAAIVFVALIVLPAVMGINFLGWPVGLALGLIGEIVRWFSL